MTYRDKPDPPLRCVILCDGLEFPAWQAECLRQAIDSGHLNVVGLVQRAHTDHSLKDAKWRKRWRERHLALWRVFERFCVKPFSKAIVQISMARLLGDVPLIKDIPVKIGKYSETLGDEAVSFVATCSPDLVLRFSYGILKGEILNLPRYGVWSFHHGDPAAFRGQPPGFWEMVEGAKSAGAILQKLGERLDAGDILHHGQFALVPHSYAKTRDNQYFGSAPWLARVCADIRHNGWDAVRTRHTEIVPDGRVYKQPNNKQTISFAKIILRARLKTFITFKLHRQNWTCGVVDKPIDIVAGLSGDTAQSEALQSTRWMQPSKNEFFADPFGFEEKPDRLRLFFERYYWSQEKGVIATATYEDGAFGQASDVLVTPSHLSYPYIRKNAEVLEILPEQNASGRMKTYQWIDGQMLESNELSLDPNLFDSTIIDYDGLLWLFALQNDWTSNTQLHLFFKEKSKEDWTAHPLNPVKSNIGSARPAGTPFVSRGRLYRPAQDCASHYGSAVVINEIIVLSRTDFVERDAGRLKPVSSGPQPYGLHTISAVGNKTLIDGARRERVPLRSIRHLVR